MVVYLVNVFPGGQRASGDNQEPMSKSMQLHYFPVTAFPYTDLFLDRISRELDSRGSHKKLIDVIVSRDRSCLSFTKEKVY